MFEERTWHLCGACGQEADHSGGCPMRIALEAERVKAMTDAVVEELQRQGYVLEKKA